MTQKSNIKRILLKLSGESISGPLSFGIDFDACKNIASFIHKIRNDGIQIGLVTGGGNIFRGINLKSHGIERSPADQIGMLATLMNGIALQQALLQKGCPAKVMSALECPRIADSFTWRDAIRCIDEGVVLIFVGGTGNPYFTTDTAAALRASEINADLLVKATKVDGVFNKDPKIHTDAIKYEELTYSKALEERLGIMDATALAMCRSNAIPTLVIEMGRLEKESFNDIILRKDKKGSIIHN